MDENAMLLFSVDLKYQTDLNNKKVTADLRQAFKKHKIGLSQKVTVTIEKQNSEWLIIDKIITTESTLLRELKIN